MRSATCIAAPLGDEVVMMSIDTGHYYCFNAVAATIWERIAEPRRIDALCQSLRADFDAPPAEIEGDVIELIDRLVELGIVGIRE